jgi:hypothetical protein
VASLARDAFRVWSDATALALEPYRSVLEEARSQALLSGRELADWFGIEPLIENGRERP